MDLKQRLQKALGDAYTVERALEGGGMSRVFVAYDTALGRRVVIKTLGADGGQVSADRFRREVRLAASLQQANIVPIHTTGEVDGLPYYTMPFVEGESLRARLATQGRLSISEAINVLRDIARALAFAHEHGVVHRDIKPDNVLLSGDAAVVIDFGIAKAIEVSRTHPASPNLTREGASLGTPAYMAPEQASGDGPVDHRADIYAFGVLAFELLAGAHPFEQKTATGMLAAHLTKTPPDLRGLRPEVHETLAELVMQCLAKDPAARPSSGRELVERLDPAVESSSWAGERRRGLGRQAPHMVAVLPFNNLSSDPEDEYFSDGMTEDIIAQLSQIGSLRVISRTSAMRYRNSDRSLKEIGAALGASHVMEGSVRRAGSRLRIVAQLIDVGTDAHLWAETFDRDVTDVFALQSEVAENIAEALHTRLSPDERQRVARRPTEDQDAYNLFLLGRHHHNQGSSKGFGRAIHFYGQAVARDPEFGRAWAALAMAHHWHLAGYFGVRPLDVAERVVEYASRALEIDPDIAEAHTMLGEVAGWTRLDQEESRSRHQEALRLSPNLAYAHLCYGSHLMRVGRTHDAVEEGLIALELDPAAEIVHVHANWFRYLARKFDEAVSSLTAAEGQFGRRTLPIALGETLIAVGRAQEAVESFRHLCRSHPSQWNVGHLAWALAAAGEKAEARTVLRELHAREEDEYVWPLAMGIAYGHLGELDTAFQYLERSLEDRVAWIQIPDAPTFDPVREDSRFDDLVRRIRATPHVG